MQCNWTNWLTAAELWVLIHFRFSLSTVSLFQSDFISFFPSLFQTHYARIPFCCELSISIIFLNVHFRFIRFHNCLCNFFPIFHHWTLLLLLHNLHFCLLIHLNVSPANIEQSYIFWGFLFSRYTILNWKYKD